MGMGFSRRQDVIDDEGDEQANQAETYHIDQQIEQKNNHEGYSFF